MSHQCVIGTLRDTDLHYGDIIPTLKNEASQWNNHSEFMNMLEGKDRLKIDYKAIDFIDSRKSGCITKYNYCPYCGLVIDWIGIKGLFK